MDTLQQLKDEYKYECNITKKFFDAYPEDKNDYAPHEKSMKMMDLATHIAEVFGWAETIVKTSDMDLADHDMPERLKTRKELIERLDNEYKKGNAGLELFTESELNKNWSISMNGQKLMERSKYGALRHGLNQISHHRAQLGVYYRLLDIAVPSSYGPSADEQNF